MPVEPNAQAFHQWLHSDVTPLKEIRVILTEMKRSPDNVKKLNIKGETIPLVDNYGWVRHEHTGKKWWTFTFEDGQSVTFVQDSDGVRIAPNPDDPALIIGKLY